MITAAGFVVLMFLVAMALLSWLAADHEPHRYTGRHRQQPNEEQTP